MSMKTEARLISVAAFLLPSVQAFFFVTPVVTAGFAHGLSVAPATAAQAVMRVSGMESTPNPSSFKFELDQSFNPGTSSVSPVRGVTYTSSTAAGAPEQIHRVLEIQDVESVYALADWICINKKPSAKWDAIVPAAVEALGGAAESLDPLTLLMTSGGDGESSRKSEMDGVAIRLQVSNGIPIQVEACPPGGTPIRRKLSRRFVDAMMEFVASAGDEMAFFKGRQWMPRGVRYPAEEEHADVDEGLQDVKEGGGSGITSPTTASKATVAEFTEEALAAAVDEIELAYHESRLSGAVQAAIALQKNAVDQATESSAAAASSAAASNGGSSSGQGEEDSYVNDSPGGAASAQAAVLAAAAVLQSPSADKGEVIGAVDALCGLAENEAVGGGGAARNALDALIGFSSSGDGPVAARRAAVAYIGGAGDAAGSAGLEAVAAVFRGDGNAGVRRTAGDALSDLGNPTAVPIAVAGLRDKSKLVRWRAARVVGELAGREQDAAALDEAREGEMEFEVAFEMADAARKIRARATASSGGGERDNEAVAGVGPVWKQIQERAGK